MTEEKTKRCAKCKEKLLLENFGFDKSRLGGLNKYCKGCAKIIRDKFRSSEKGKKSHKLSNAKWKQSESGKASAKKYRESERGKVSSARCRRNYRDNLKRPYIVQQLARILNCKQSKVPEEYIPIKREALKAVRTAKLNKQLNL